MRGVRSRDHHQLDTVDRKQFFESADLASLGIGLLRLGAMALQYRGQAQAFNRGDYRRVKCSSCESEPNQSDVDHLFPRQLPNEFTEQV